MVEQKVYRITSPYSRSRLRHKWEFEAWYDERADYNTNAKSYYDYLARLEKFLKDVIEDINELLMNSHVPATMNVLNTELLKVTADGKDKQSFHLDGKALQNQISEILKMIETIVTAIGKGGKVPQPTVVYDSDDGSVKNSYNVPNYEQYDEIELTYGNGSTTETIRWKIKDLMTDRCHLSFFNISDNPASFRTFIMECATKLEGGNKLNINWVKGGALDLNGGSSTAYLYNENNNQNILHVIIYNITCIKYVSLFPEKTITK